MGDEGRLLIPPEALVGHLNGLPVPHCVDNDGEPALAGGDVLKKDAVPHILGLVEDVVQRQRLEEPLPDAATLKVVPVGDVVPQRAVALDLDAEGVLDGNAVVVEGALRQGFAVLVDGAPLPLAGYLRQGDGAATVDRVDQPDIPVEIVLCHCVFRLLPQR